MCGNFDLNYVYKSKRENIEKLSNQFQKKETEEVYEYENAVVLPFRIKYQGDPMQGYGGVVDENCNYIEESSQLNRFNGKYEFDLNCEFEDKKVVFCGYFKKAWGHFITEVVSRLWYALKNDTSVDKYVFVDELDGSAVFSGNYYEFLKLLNIEDKVVVINKPIRYAKVLIPEHGYLYNDHYTEAFKKMYEYINNEGLKRYSGPAYDKVYFSKSKIVGSLVSNLNIKSIDKYFKKNGYKIFYPEELSLIDTIGIMQNAKFFAGITSSLSHNQLFGHYHQTTICIEKQAFYNPYQISIGNITGSKTVFIDAFRHIFPVGSYGPFLFDYTKHLEDFTKDNNMIPVKPMSNLKYRKLFKKYMMFYFNLNNKMPPNWMYRQYVIDMSREAYDNTIENGKIFKISVFQRVKLKVRKLLFSVLGPY